MTNKPQIIIFTDGGAKPNPGPGGWGALLVSRDTGNGNDYTKELSGADPDTTNNRMELTAAIEALRALKQPSQVTLHTDSQYLKNGITGWLYGWIKNNWLTSKDEPVQNRDLWQALHAEIQRHDMAWEWVKGHAGNEYNERVDQLATQARLALTGESPEPPAPAAHTADIDAQFEIAIRVSSPPGQSGGGWAVRIADPNPDAGMGTPHTGHASEATSNQLVLIAAAAALRTLPAGTSARVYCPDDYLFKGMTEWITSWQKHGWRTSSKKPVQNRELWQALLTEANARTVQWVLESRKDKLAIARGLDKLAADAAGVR